MSGLVERRCEHGVRWPHPCDDCHNEDCKPHNLIARITALEAENERMKAALLHITVMDCYTRDGEEPVHLVMMRLARQALGDSYDAN